jgi:DNA-binding NtrC family response regulator
MHTYVVLVHNESVFLRACEFSLRSAGYVVEAFDNPLSALSRLERPDHVEVLVTRTQFPPGQPNGVALANMARAHKSSIQIVITSAPELGEHGEGLGVVLQAPVSPANVVKAVRNAMIEDQAARWPILERGVDVVTRNSLGDLTMR